MGAGSVFKLGGGGEARGKGQNHQPHFFSSDVGHFILEIEEKAEEKNWKNFCITFKLERQHPSPKKLAGQLPL